MRPLLIAFALTGCTLPHVAPLPREAQTAAAAAVLVEVSCNWPDEFTPTRWGTGVVISEHYVLTAAHVTNCPLLPNIHVQLPDGRRFPMIVERDDAMFPRGTDGGQDIARLEILSFERFGLGIAPPELASTPTNWATATLNGTTWVGDLYCASTLRGRECGSRDLYRHGVVLDMRTRDGDSGAGVYNDADQLAGVVIGGGVLTGGDLAGTFTTHFAPVDAYWLEGT